MMNKRTWKKKRVTVETTSAQEMREYTEKMQECMEKMDDISRMFYGKVREMEKNHEKKYLLQIIRLREDKRNNILKLKKKYEKMREEMIGDIRNLHENSPEYNKVVKYVKAWLEEQNKLIKYMKIDFNELTDILEDWDVEIIDGHEFDKFDSKIMHSLERIDSDCREKHEQVAEVKTSAYRWKGQIIKPMMVSVYICNE